jgi:uncharacterized repeat protein (TIGR01451 family)
MVYIDTNFNGVREAEEGAEAGVFVRLYNAAGNLIGQTSTDVDGHFMFPALNDGQNYLLEYDLPDDRRVSAIGVNNGTEVQKVTIPYCSADLALTSGQSTCGNSSEIILSCFANDIVGNNDAQETIVGLTHDFNAASPVSVYATKGETGSVWGMAFNSRSATIYSAAFVKQHASLTEHGHDAIFATRANESNSTVLFAKLSDLGQEVGELTATDATDCSYGQQVGKIGLGALEMDDNNTRLFVTNLYNNSIVSVDLENPNSSTTRKYNVPNPACSFNDFRIFALKYHEGRLYTGVTCTAETSKEEDDTYIHVYSLDLESSNFTLEFSTDYSRGVWTDENDNATLVAQWLTDIEFTDEGNMVLALSDRKGHNYCRGVTSRLDDQSGNILLVERINNTWVLENNGATSQLTGTGANNGEGPGGGEFFGDDFFPGDPGNQPEVALGSIVAIPGTGEVITAVFDPLFNTYSGGLHSYNTSTGEKTSSKELYNSNISSYFGKATGFGDIIASCGDFPVAVGNYVWVDSNNNGLQDAGEEAVTDLTIQLYDTDCQLIASTVTDTNGHYSFNNENVDLNNDGQWDGMLKGENYFIAIHPETYDNESNSFVIDNIFYNPTEFTNNTNRNSDLAQSSVQCIQNSLSAIPVIAFTAESGNITNLDIGLVESSDFDLALTKKLISSNDFKIGDQLEFAIEVFNQGGRIASEYELVDYLTDAFTFKPEDNPGWSLQDGILRKVITENLNPSASRTEILKLDFTGSTDITDFINYSEIAYHKDHTGLLVTDTDSTPDDIRDNDAGGNINTATDDLITDDGTIDEDDHDPAEVKVLDLALKNVIRDARLYNEGEYVVFDMTVYNQGNQEVASFEVTHMYPQCLTFEQSENTEWLNTMPGFAKTTVNENLLPGENRVVSIKLLVEGNCDYEDIVNIAEISAFTCVDPTIQTDIDSDADDFMFNDNGGSPYDFTDNLITDSGVNDEDDHDPAVFSVSRVDLALMKTTEHEVYNIGDEVQFEIKVYNQGDVPIGRVTLYDYLPEYTSLSDDSWNADHSMDPTGHTVYKIINFENGLAAGDDHTETITLTIDDDAPSGLLFIIEAEIAEMRNGLGADISHHDIDSQADNISNNDMGGVFMSVTDNLIDDNGSMDEDDHDPAGFFIADIDVVSSCDCLDNATGPYNGLFLERIEITSLSGHTWFIDELNNIFSTSSTPDNLINFVTGEAGYTLTEYPQDDNISLYVFEGVFVDSKAYNIRFTNGDGAFLQASGGGPACSYNRPVISSPTGLSAVCTTSIHQYTVSGLGACTQFEWTLSGGGSIVGANDQTTVTVEWDNTSGGPYVLQLTPLCGSYCLAPVIEEISVGQGGGVMSCLTQVNVSLNNDCTSSVDADVFLTSPIPFGTVYQLMLLDHHGNVIPNNFLTEEYLWESLTAKVVDPCSGNSCWSTLTVEDKMAPAIQCGDFELPCFLMDTYEPLVLDNCTDATYSLISETVEPLFCDENYIKEVTRTYVTRDAYGNESQPCSQVIRLERFDFSELVPPQNYLISETNNLICADSIYNEMGEPDVSITGAPTLNGYPIFPIQDLYCNVAVEYEDIIVADFGCVRKIMRTWRVYEDWCSVGEYWNYVQTIEILDNEAPEVHCAPDVTVSSGGGPNCERELTIDLPTVEDNCSSDFTIDISYVGGFIKGAEGTQNLTIPAGTYDVLFNVYDACENLSTCEVTVTVVDERPPVAVCDENTVVSLRSDGTAKAFAHTFDDGSYDDCSLFNTLVRRMDSPCDCNEPVFEDMHFLGEREGRYYYLSKFLTHGSKAFLYSEAYGGMLLRIESEGEADWVYEQTRKFITSAYYIGLSDADHPGEFTWSNHEDPSIDLWASGQPIDEGDNVVTNSDGEWVVVDGNDVEAYYVLELTDPCGFSDEVHFCCEDATEEQMVIFRAIDYFGKFNECMVNVEVQDKVPPQIQCPPHRDLDCDVELDLQDLSIYGTATATDLCFVDIREEVIDERNSCGFGSIIRRFIAEDNTGFSTCDQELIFETEARFDPATIVWPLDFTTDLGCNSTDLHPDSLDFEFSRPQFEINRCAEVAATYDDQIFDFSGASGSDACLKILRRWSVIDWCQMDDPGYEPEFHDQVIKVNNVVGPTILAGCDSLVIRTPDCDSTDVVFAVQAQDDCTPDQNLRARLLIDIDSDGQGEFDYEEEVFSGIISFSGKLPIGEHFALISFTDQCGNTTSCTKFIIIENNKGPAAACIDGISIALQPMDLDGDGDFDNEMACITPDMLDASSTHICDFDFTLSFSENPADTIFCFDCNDLGENIVELWVIDEFGNTDFCETTVEVQDNNDGDYCPRFDLALIKRLDTSSTPGPFMQGDDISYELEIINQGNIPAFNIELVDYIPDGLILNDPNWSDTGDGKAELLDPIEFLEDSTNVTLSISFVIDEDFMGTSITNAAEISFADDDEDPDNMDPEDSDSMFDDENDDQVGGNDEVDNDNGDDDDHDPETVEVIQIFDLSLNKECARFPAPPFSPGSSVRYIITVSNEGTLDAHDVQIADHIPFGLILTDTQWTQNGNTATLNEAIPLVASGSSVDVEIDFEIAEDFMGSTITNVAEIIDPDNNFPQEDVDSTPDNDDGDQSEDDEDEKTIEVVQNFDLALTKVINIAETPDSVNLGDDVTFTVTVYNQGSLNATDIRVMDYIPEGLSFDPLKNSDFGPAGNNAQASVPFLAIDDSVELEIILTVDSDIPSARLINNAEITAGTNAMGLPDQDDELSNTNDGSSNELSTDNDIDDERAGTPGTQDNPLDEDDYDPAAVDVFCPPTAVCQDITIDLDVNGQLVLTVEDIDDGSFAPCGQEVSLSLDQTNFDCDDIGTLTVSLTASVSSGLEDSCNAEVTIQDTTPPVADCQDITVELDSDGAAEITAAQINDNSSDACNELSFLLDETEFDCDDVGEVNIVTLTVSDGSSNTSSCTANVTVEDNTDPILVCRTGLDTLLGIDGMLTLDPEELIMSVSDNCTDVDLEIDLSTFDCEDVTGDPIPVVVTATDSEDNSVSCTSLVLVQDLTAPECTVEPDGMVIMADLPIAPEDIGFNVEDNCTAPADINVAIDPVLIDCDFVGTQQTITVTVTDESFNASTCSITVDVVDMSTPVCLVTDITVELDENGQASITPEQVDIGSTAGCDEDPTLSVTPMNFDCTDIEDNDAIFTITGENGMSAMCELTVTVVDDIDPVVSCEDPFEVALNGQGIAFVTPGDVIDLITENCMIDQSTTNMSIVDCTNEGQSITITATVTDQSGNTGTCSTEVSVIDDLPPTCTLLQDVTVEPNQLIELSELVADVNTFFDDNCADASVQTTIEPMIFDCGDAGMTELVTVTVTDDAGNTGTCTTGVMVVDNAVPTCLTQDITVELDAMGNYNLMASEIDNGSNTPCDPDPVLTVDPDAFDCTDITGVQVVTLTVLANNGNSAQCTANVTVEDNISPELDCTDPFTVQLNGNGNVSITMGQIVLSSDDNCDFTVTVTPLMFNCDNIGENVVTAVAADSSGNETECEVVVTVEDDMAPSCVLEAVNVVVFPGQEITIDMISNPLTFFDDNCSDDSEQTIIDPMSFGCMDTGLQVVTVTVSDESGNISICTAEIEVVDDEAPECTTQDITVTLDASGMPSITGDDIYTGNGTECDMDPMLSVTPNTFDCMDAVNNPNVVTLTVTTSNGNTSNCTANITVLDEIDPVIDCTADFEVSLDANGEAQLTQGQIVSSLVENCSATISIVPMNFDCTNIGDQVVTATATDPSGNSDMCTTTVTVVDDSAPSCTLIADITVAPDQEITLDLLTEGIDPFFTDNCSSAPANVDGVPTAFDCMNLGLQVVVVTVTDDEGNSATCSSNVTVEDIPAPICITVGDITVNLDDEGNYTLIVDEINDGSLAGCAGIADLSINPEFLGCNDVGLSPIEVVLTVTDNNMNSSTCTADVTVIDDIAPEITCIDDTTVDLDSNGEVNLMASDIVLTAEDGCGIFSQVLDMTMFSCADKMTTVLVTATVTDNNMNTTQCTADVTIEDNEAPECTIAAGLSFPPEVTITPAQVLGSFMDNCATSSSNSVLTPNEFTCNDLGDQMVELLVTDDCGNTSTCSGTIEIVDSSEPTAVCVDITVSLDSNGLYALDAAEVDGGSNAACGTNLTLEVEPDSFDCGDIGDNVVTLTVTASGGDTDDCTATVTVVDDSDPIIVCPADMVVPCETDISNPADFGAATVSDNCDMSIPITETSDVDVNACNVGTLERTFMVMDDSGNTAECTQVITIEGPANPLVEADITWPTTPFDAGDCIPDPDNIDSGMPIVDTSNLDCFNIGISFTDAVTGDAQCDGTILRTWVVTDSCQAPGGVFEFTQTINVNDVVGPDIAGPSDMTIILPPGNTTCDTFLNLGATVTDCTGGFTASNDSPFADNNNIADALGTYPVGLYNINITATDACGNDSIYSYTVNVVDTTALILDCSKIIDNIQMNQMVVVDTSQAQANIDFGSCMGGNFNLSFSNIVPDQDTIVATCSDVGIATYTIYLWSGNLLVDSCTNLFQIVDPGGFCTSPITGTVIGTVSSADDRLMDDVNVKLEGSGFDGIITDTDGSYAFPAMNFGGDYRVVPEKDKDYLNGVTTLDLIEIQKHILGSKKLDSPYKLIAADIDRSGQITGADMLELRKLILGVYDALPNNKSWRMIDKSHKFIDPANPFVGDIPESYDILDFNQSMIVDFIGVKVGDVNNTALVNAADRFIDKRSAETFAYQLTEEKYSKNEYVELEFSASDISELRGIQHSLLVNTNVAEFLNIESMHPDFNESNFFVWDEEGGVINMSWDGELDDNVDQPLFRIALRMKTSARTSELVRIADSDYMRAEAYMADSGKAVNVDIEFITGSQSAEISLYQNVPNPWTNNTEISFFMPQAEVYRLNIYSINGQLLHTVDGNASQGVNRVELSNELFNKGGVLYYELITGNTRLVNKMLFVK